MTNHLTLTELQRSIKLTLTERYAMPVWVSAEIAELKVNYSGHCYLELVDKGDGKGVAQAQTRAVIWRSTYQSIAAYFEADTGSRLDAGMKILAKVLVTYHELYGLSLQITQIDTSYTLGEVERQKQLTIAQLKSDGVWEMNHEMTLPSVVQRIAVISSPQAAGFQDFMQEIARSEYALHTTLFEAVMQGVAAEESIIAALCAVADKAEEFDAIVVIRGGGSTNDLSCFNSYMLSAYIAQFPLPVITGIGHDKDVSVADMVACQPLKTPTAVATWLVERAMAMDGWLEGAAHELEAAVRIATHSQHIALERAQGDILRYSATLVERKNSNLAQLHSQIESLARELLSKSRFKLSLLPEQLSESTHRVLCAENQRISSAQQLIESRSPKSIMRLGFSVVRVQGAVISSTSQLSSGDTLEVEMADGVVRSNVI